jgi:hypothetical protein
MLPSLEILPPCPVAFDSKSSTGRRPSIGSLDSKVVSFSSLTLPSNGMTILCLAQPKAQRVDWPGFIRIIARLPGNNC